LTTAAKPAKPKLRVVAIPLGILGALVVALLFPSPGSAFERSERPRPDSVIAALGETSTAKSLLSEEAYETADYPDIELGTPVLERMQVLRMTDISRTSVFPIGEEGICLFHEVQTPEGGHAIRTCTNTEVVVTRGLAIRIHLGETTAGGYETVILLPDGYTHVEVGAGQRLAVENNVAVFSSSVSSDVRAFRSDGSIEVASFGK
jgi:hypothetical protein